MTTILDHPPLPAASVLPDPAPTSSVPTWQDFHALEDRLDKRAGRRDAWTMAICLFAAIAVIFSLIGMGFGTRAIDDRSRPVGAAARAAPAQALATSPGPVTLSDFKVQVTATTLAAGQVTIQITNIGAMQHELLVFRSDLAPADYPVKDGNIDEEAAGITKISDGDNLEPGTTQSRSIDLGLPGTYLFVCNLAGHFHAGMFSVVTVK